MVDDEPQILRVLRASLQGSGYEVHTAANGVEALNKMEAARPDLVITDLAMPLMNGLELTEAIRKQSQVPILVLSVRDTDRMKVEALDKGADDYLTKPFSMFELLARVRAQLRRAGEARPPEATGPLALGDFVIDEEAHHVTVRGAEVRLTPKEYDLLLAFAHTPDRTLTHNTLLRKVWGGASGHQPENLRVLVASLRKKIEHTETQRYIESEPWVGYRFQPAGVPPDDAIPASR